MSTQRPTRNDYIESLWLHVRCMQRTGIRFDAASRVPEPDSGLSCDLLEALRNESADCRRCPLCSTRTRVVFGEGCDKARLMFVGDCPDSDSDSQGRPFAGESGQLLTRIIEAIKLTRDRVYLTTAVKCRVPQGEPGKNSLQACLPFLQRQIEIIKPEIICTLGPVAALALRPGVLDAPPRGKFFGFGKATVMPTHHPALLLRRPELKQETWADVQAIQRELEAVAPR
jgi:DNA polymerase